MTKYKSFLLNAPGGGGEGRERGSHPCHIHALPPCPRQPWLSAVASSPATILCAWVQPGCSLAGKASTGSVLQLKAVSYNICHAHNSFKEKFMSGNFCIPTSLRKLNPLVLNPDALRSTRRLLLAIVRTELILVLAAKSSILFNSCWVAWKLSIMGNNGKL